ncbi:MAG: hypothetical protein ABIA77_00875 [Candidatus Omnitrophota bacterium]
MRLSFLFGKDSFFLSRVSDKIQATKGGDQMEDKQTQGKRVTEDSRQGEEIQESVHRYTKEEFDALAEAYARQRNNRLISTIPFCDRKLASAGR